MDTRERHKVCLEFGQVDIESTVETKAGGDGADHLGDEAVQVVETWTRNVELAVADVVDSFIVHEKSAIGMLNGAVSGQDCIVWLNHGRRDAWGRVDGEFELGLLAVFSSQAFEKQGTEARAGPTTKGVEDQKPLQGAAVVYMKRQEIVYKNHLCASLHTGNTTNTVDHLVGHLFSNGIVTASICDASVQSAWTSFLACMGQQSIQLFAASSFPLINSSGWKS